MRNFDGEPSDIRALLTDRQFGRGILDALAGRPLDSDQPGISYERGRLFASSFPDLALAAIERRIGIIAMANMAAERDEAAVVAVFYV